MNDNLQKHYETIADGLAEKGFACIDGFLSESDVDAILSAEEFTTDLSGFKKAGTGQEKLINEAVRNDYILWIDRMRASPEILVFLEKIEELMTYLNRSLYLSLKNYEFHTTIYPPGGFYKRHLDQFKTSGDRKISVICYLNFDWKKEEGGQLRMHLADGPKDFYPIAGRLICFRSDQVEHEVVAATRDRRSLTGWLLDIKSL